MNAQAWSPHQAGQMFPPALVELLRRRVEPEHVSLAGVQNSVLYQLVTTAFFAGLETYEAERHPVRILFTGRRSLELMPGGAPASAVAPVTRWRAFRFEVPRPFSVRELVKLAVVAVDDRIYSIVTLLGEALVITGLAREGIRSEAEPFLKLVASRPGRLSIRSGRERLLEYERGSILTSGEGRLFSAGAVRRRLETIAQGAGVDSEALPGYVESVKALIREMSAHGHGGILTVSPEHRPELPDNAAYRMTSDSSLATLVRLSRLLDRPDESAGPPPVSERAHRAVHVPPISWSHLLRTEFLTEIDRLTREIGALTAIDGATILNRELELVGFGVGLPVAGITRASQAGDRDGGELRPFDLGIRGARHRAGVTYAGEHPGSVVFVASQDGPIMCMCRASLEDDVVVWHLDPDHADPWVS